MVGVATILLGAGAGVLGSTINPFATGVAVSAMKDAGIEFNQGTIILIAVVLWLTTLAIAAFFVVQNVKANAKNNTKSEDSENHDEEN